MNHYYYKELEKIAKKKRDQRLGGAASALLPFGASVATMPVQAGVVKITNTLRDKARLQASKSPSRQKALSSIIKSNPDITFITDKNRVLGNIQKEIMKGNEVVFDRESKRLYVPRNASVTQVRQILPRNSAITPGAIKAYVAGKKAAGVLSLAGLAQSYRSGDRRTSNKTRNERRTSAQGLFGAGMLMDTVPELYTDGKTSLKALMRTKKKHVPAALKQMLPGGVAKATKTIGWMAPIAALEYLKRKNK